MSEVQKPFMSEEGDSKRIVPEFEGATMEQSSEGPSNLNLSIEGKLNISGNPLEDLDSTTKRPAPSEKDGIPHPTIESHLKKMGNGSNESSSDSFYEANSSQ